MTHRVKCIAPNRRPEPAAYGPRTPAARRRGNRVLHRPRGQPTSVPADGLPYGVRPGRARRGQRQSSGLALRPPSTHPLNRGRRYRPPHRYRVVRCPPPPGPDQSRAAFCARDPGWRARGQHHRTRHGSRPESTTHLPAIPAQCHKAPRRSHRSWFRSPELSLPIHHPAMTSLSAPSLRVARGPDLRLIHPDST